MKAVTLKNSHQKLAEEIQFARLSVAKAQSQLTSAKEQMRIARRRRKAAKQAARRAKKEARLAKREFTDAKLVVAQLEEKLSRSEQAATRGKAKKAVRKTANNNRDKKPAPTPAPAGLKKKVVGKLRKPRARIRRIRATKQPITAPPEVAEPQSPLVPPVTDATVQGEALGSANHQSGSNRHPG